MMIDVVAIDNRHAETELLRLAGQFALSRFFTAKQQKKLHIVVEVSGLQPAIPVTRDQLMAKPGLMRAAKYHFHFTVNVAQSFEMALSQMMHELVHLSQIVNNRYHVSSKKQKINGKKQLTHHAKWLGKKQGVIDQIEWDQRPWEREAVLTGEQVAQEFMQFVQGQQAFFAAQGQKKECQLREVSMAMAPLAPAPVAEPQQMLAPQMMTSENMTSGATPAMMAPEMPPQDTPPQDAMGQMPDQSSDQMRNQVPNEVTDDQLIDDLLSDDALSGTNDAALASPSFDAPTSDFGASGDFGVPFDAPDFAASDAVAPDVLSPDEMPAGEMPAGEMPAGEMPVDGVISDEMIFGAMSDQTAPDQTAPDQMAPDQTAFDKKVFVLGVPEARMLKASALQAKRDELRKRGLA